jgi:hypothetical protein
MIEENGRFSIVVPGFGRVEVEATKIGAVILRWKGENGTEQVVSLEIDPTNPTTVSAPITWRIALSTTFAITHPMMKMMIAIIRFGTKLIKPSQSP